MMRELLSHGADPNARSEAAPSALALACLRDNLDAVRLLLEAGADANDRIRLKGGWTDVHVKYNTPLMIAARSDNHEVCPLTACSMST